jgi:hypothetical protein
LQQFDAVHRMNHGDERRDELHFVGL